MLKLTTVSLPEKLDAIGVLSPEGKLVAVCENEEVANFVAYAIEYFLDMENRKLHVIGFNQPKNNNKTNSVVEGVN